MESTESTYVLRIKRRWSVPQKITEIGSGVLSECNSKHLLQTQSESLYCRPTQDLKALYINSVFLLLSLFSLLGKLAGRAIYFDCVNFFFFIFFESFHHIKALYVQMMDLYLIFQFFKGRCHGNQIMLRKCYRRRLIPLAFGALVLENKLQYHGLAVRINSRDYGATSSKIW